MLRRIYAYGMRTSVPKIQGILRFKNFNAIEKNGHCSTTTRLKLLKDCIFDFPFSLGRTIRGVSFQHSDSDIFSSALEMQKTEYFDVEIFSRIIADAYSSELPLKIKDKIPTLNNSSLGVLPLWASCAGFCLLEPPQSPVGFGPRAKNNRQCFQKRGRKCIGSPDWDLRSPRRAAGNPLRSPRINPKRVTTRPDKVAMGFLMWGFPVDPQP